MIRPGPDEVTRMSGQKHAYGSYKHTGVDWLGEAPAHWETVPVKALFTQTRVVGQEDMSLLSVYRDYGVIPRYSRDDNYNRPSLDLSNYQLVEPTDLVLNKMKTWQGSLAVSDDLGIVSPAYIVCKSIHNEHHRFLHYLLRSAPYVAKYARLSYGVRPAQWDLRWEDFRLVPALIPPLEEQRGIADFLDRETDKIDALIAKKERLIELLQEKRTALISRAVTKGLDPNVPMKDSGIEWLGEIPAHWQVKRIRHVAELVNGYPFDSGLFSLGQGHPLIRIRDLYSDGTEVCFDGPEVDEAVVQTGDVLIGMDGHFNVARWKGPRALLNQRVCCLRCTSQELDRFLAYVLPEPLKVINDVTFSTTVKHLSSNDVARVQFAVPPVVEQRAIADFLDRETAQVDKLIAKIGEAIDRLREYRTALISAAVTGKIDVREAAP